MDDTDAENNNKLVEGMPTGPPPLSIDVPQTESKEKAEKELSDNEGTEQKKQPESWEKEEDEEDEDENQAEPNGRISYSSFGGFGHAHGLGTPNTASPIPLKIDASSPCVL